MSEITRPQLAVYVAAAIAIVLIGARYLRQSAPAGAPHPAAHAAGGSVRVQSGSSGPAVVDVAGAVRRPGVYRLPAGARVEQAVRRAGGPAPGADLGAVNLAAKVADGVQIVVPAREASGSAGSPGVAGSAGAAGGLTGPVNLNTATLEQLDALDGVGPATAQRILDYRQKHGGFRSVSDLDQVPGIGPKKLAALRDKVTA